MGRFPGQTSCLSLVLGGPRRFLQPRQQPRDVHRPRTGPATSLVGPLQERRACRPALPLRPERWHESCSAEVSMSVRAGRSPVVLIAAPISGLPAVEYGRDIRQAVDLVHHPQRGRCLGTPQPPRPPEERRREQQRRKRSQGQARATPRRRGRTRHRRPSPSPLSPHPADDPLDLLSASKPAIAMATRGSRASSAPD
jgi:hypothetical protein